MFVVDIPLLVVTLVAVGRGSRMHTQKKSAEKSYFSRLSCEVLVYL